MNTLFKELNDKKAIAIAEVTKFNNAIIAMQELCEHKWSFTGKDRHRGDEYYVCTECGKEKRE